MSISLRSSCFALVAAASFALVAACSSGSSSGGASNDGGGASSPGALGALCSASAPCATGLSCATSGSLLGRCTADCTTDLSLCGKQFGANTVCMNAAQCALTCTTASQCPGSGECTPLSGGVSACITSPNGAPDAGPLPNGACANVGGAFGDSVANGGYRCTPSNSGSLGTTIDQCVNGTWATAKFTCGCSVNGTPSECFDITSAGSAQCSYGASTCAQCVPGSGCQ
jgi:hypothetical protein